MRDYKQILKDNGITLLYSPRETEEKGCYLQEYKAVVVRCDLNEVETMAVLSHELEHALSEDELNELNAPAVHMKQERLANEAMADDLVNEYLASCETLPTYVDVDWFIESRHIATDLYTYIDCAFRRVLA